MKQNMKSQIITASSSNFQHDLKKRTSAAKPPGLCLLRYPKPLTAADSSMRPRAQGTNGERVTHLASTPHWGVVGDAPQISGSLGDLDFS